MELQRIQNKIYEIRGQRVMLDFDLAEMYETETKRLKEAVRRNMDRFPDDFMFKLSNDEYENLRTQNATSKRGGTRYMPFAFTEQGVAMLSSVLNSKKAIQVNIAVIRAFVVLRQHLADYKDIRNCNEINYTFWLVLLPFLFVVNSLNIIGYSHRLRLKKEQNYVANSAHFISLQFLKENIATLEKQMNLNFKDINQALHYLLNKDEQQISQHERKQIGFKK
ncbi:MAG: ORF6N domain-containing protein [Lutibacter sp.]|nr:ORF6N domain-containing protein [Lutibacter sp.]MDP3945382.1 ORF6N domain-containing protein [Lutibacter sp.]